MSTCSESLPTRFSLNGSSTKTRDLYNELNETAELKRAIADPRSALNALRSELTERLDNWWPSRLIHMASVPVVEEEEEADVEDVAQLLPSSYNPAE